MRNYLNIIIFTPDDLEIIKGSPNIRRNLLNIQLSQISQEYLKSINEYNKILKTRNEYLKIIFSNSIADKTYLDIITDKLIEKAIIIYQSRKRYIDCINLEIDDYFHKIYGEKGLKVSYIPNISLDDFEYETIRKRLNAGWSLEEIINTPVKEYNKYYLPCNNSTKLLKEHCKNNNYNYNSIVSYINKYNLQPHEALAKWLKMKNNVNIAQIAKELGVSRQAIHQRLQRGQSLEQIMISLSKKV